MKKYIYFLLIAAMCFGVGIGYFAFDHQPVQYKADVYFSPEGQVRDKIMAAVGGARASIDIAIFDFTSKEILAALERPRLVMLRSG